MTGSPPLPPDQISPARGNDEKLLVRLQQQITTALEQTIRQRDALLLRMNRGDRHVSQRRLAELLTLGSVKGGGDPYTENAVYRAIRMEEERRNGSTQG